MAWVPSSCERYGDECVSDSTTVLYLSNLLSASITLMEAVVESQKETNIRVLYGAGSQKANELESQDRRDHLAATRW